MSTSRTAVIGAGIVGISSALWLQEAGRQVVVIDPNEPGSGASHGNAGCFNGSSIVPTSMPGMWSSVPRWLLDPLGPLSIRLAYFPFLLPWLWRFLRAGQIEEVRKQAQALRQLLAPSVRCIEHLSTLAGARDLIHEQGHLYVYRSDSSLQKDQLGWELRSDFGVKLDWLEQSRLRAFDPSLSTEYRHGILIRENGHTSNPGALVHRLAQHLFRRGGARHVGRATAFRLRDNKLVGIETDQGFVEASSAVVSSGAYSGELARMLGDWVPLETERGYHVMIANPESQPRIPTTDATGKFIATPMQGGLRLAGTVELGGLAAAPDWRRSRMLIELGRQMLPGLPAKVDEDRLVLWMGHRPSLPDSLPVIDRASRCRDVVYAFGHGHVGMSGGPYTGKVAADLILGKQPDINIKPFTHRRF